jgi:hypothetical protein
MVEHLGEVLEKFPGAANQTRCFAHTISISAKAVLKQFDIPKVKHGKVLSVAAQALAALGEELDVKERSEWETRDVDDNEQDDQPLDTWVDFHEELTEEQARELDASVQPVRSMLIKVRVDCLNP